MKSKPITPERIENALDRLAELMVKLGEKGTLCLPIYERLESELEAIKTRDTQMAAVLARFKQSKDRRAARSS